VEGEVAGARHLSNLQTEHKAASAREAEAATGAGAQVLKAGEAGDQLVVAVTTSVAGAVAGARTRCPRKQT
jgi:hypothetical protein